ncbi:MAG: orotate phosphoribosyltransferase [Dehalococcoidia bacterium]
MTNHTEPPDVERLAAALAEVGAIKFGAFRLKLHEQRPEAPLAPLYIDLRVLRSFPDQMDEAVAAYRQVLAGLEFDLLADVPIASSPFVAILSHLTRIPMVTPREPKGHGTGSTVEGVFTPGQTAVVVDDLVTGADSKLEAAHRLESQGLRVRDIVVLIDREQGGGEQLAAAGYTLHAAFCLSDLLAIYRRTGVIDDATYERVVEYVSATR